MFTAEPAPTPYDLHFMIGGVPVRIHPLFWLVALLLGASGNPEPVVVLGWVAAVFVSILVHEMGHVLAFRYYGLHAHVVLHSFGGLAVPDGPSAFTGVRPPRRDWLGDVAISFAGPAAGFALAAVICVAMAAGGHPVSFFANRFSLVPFTWEPLSNGRVNELVFDLMFINIFWGLVNLLPVFPLDGGQIARAVLTRLNPQDGVRQSLMLSVLGGGAVAVLAYLRLGDFFIALFFAYMAYQNYLILQSYSGGGFGGRRGW